MCFLNYYFRVIAQSIGHVQVRHLVVSMVRFIKKKKFVNDTEFALVGTYGS